MKNIKETHIETFLKPLDIYHNIDQPIQEFITLLNQTPFIKTRHSCSGHLINFINDEEQEETYFSTPYIAFSLNIKGWELFWNFILPEIITTQFISLTTFGNKPLIGLYFNGSLNDENCDNFWKIIQPIFLKYFSPTFF